MQIRAGVGGEDGWVRGRIALRVSGLRCLMATLKTPIASAVSSLPARCPIRGAWQQRQAAKADARARACRGKAGRRAGSGCAGRGGLSADDGNPGRGRRTSSDDHARSGAASRGSGRGSGVCRSARGRVTFPAGEGFAPCRNGRPCAAGAGRPVFIPPRLPSWRPSSWRPSSWREPFLRPRSSGRRLSWVRPFWPAPSSWSCPCSAWRRARR